MAGKLVRTSGKRNWREFKDEHGRFKPGNNANPAGRPKGTPNLNVELMKAATEFRHGNDTFLIALFKRAMQSDIVLMKIMDKLLTNATPEQMLQINNSFEAALQQSKGEPDGTVPSRLDRFMNARMPLRS